MRCSLLVECSASMFKVITVCFKCVDFSAGEFLFFYGLCFFLFYIYHIYNLLVVATNS